MVCIDVLKNRAPRSRKQQGRRDPYPEDSGLRSQAHLGRSENNDLTLSGPLDTLKLLDHFFLSVGIVVPVLSKPHLLSEYHKVYSTNQSQSGGTKRALLYIVLAHGAASLGRNDHNIFYKRALTQLDDLKLQTTSIELSTAWLVFSGLTVKFANMLNSSSLVSSEHISTKSSDVNH